MSAIINGDSPSVTFSDGTTQSTAFTTGSVNQAKLATGVAGTGPAFSAYLSANQTITGNTYVKLAANTEEFDTNSNYDNSTNYRFTPTVAGYYQVNGCISIYASNGINNSYISIYKNGSRFKDGQFFINTAGNDAEIIVTALIYLNGSTDYIELFGNTSQTAGTIRFNGGQQYFSYFQASMVRAA